MYEKSLGGFGSYFEMVILLNLTVPELSGIEL